MKAKQKKIRVFDIVVEDEKSFFEFFDKNFLLIKDYLLLLSGNITPSIEEYLHKNSLCYVLTQGCNIKMTDAKVQTQQVVSQTEQKVVVQEKVVYKEIESSTEATKVITKPVRSGEVIQSDGDIVIFSRVNSGAKVIGEANVTIFDTIDGIVEAYGEFIILKKIDKGYVVFNGDILDKDEFQGGLKKVLRTNDGYKIEDI